MNVAEQRANNRSALASLACLGAADQAREFHVVSSVRTGTDRVWLCGRVAVCVCLHNINIYLLYIQGRNINIMYSLHGSGNLNYLLYF